MSGNAGASVWTDALAALQLFAVDPVGTGVWLRARPGAARDRCLAMLRQFLPPGAPLKTLPLHVAEGRLLGGLDLAATLQAGKPIAERGLISEADGGVLLVAMAERLAASTTAHLTAALDTQEAIVERDGLSLRLPARFGLIALDEGLDDEAAPSALRDRLAFAIDLDAVAHREAAHLEVDLNDIVAARTRLPLLRATPAQIDALCHAAAALGIVSLRAPLMALRAARASAALAGRSAIEAEDVTLAARLVLAPRALVLPDAPPAEPPPNDPPPEDSSDDTESEQQTPDLDRALDEVILAAARAAIPDDVLAMLRAGSTRSRTRSSGKSGALQKSGARGRPTGTRRGELRAGAKLSLIETLRAAAPWQPLRRWEAGQAAQPRVIVRKDDFRIARFKQRTETTTIFVVDASGSAALHRLAEAKGAVELLLADCYIRRDQVALIAFRGQQAELLLPPTRSLARAKRSLAGLPGGGGTPLAAGLEAAFGLADAIRRKGQTPSVIVLTDGRANIARDGSAGRPKAEDDARHMARLLRGAGIASVLVDTSPRPGPAGEAIAAELGARYLALPYADATTLSRAVTAATS